MEECIIEKPKFLDRFEELFRMNHSLFHAHHLFLFSYFTSIPTFTQAKHASSQPLGDEFAVGFLQGGEGVLEGGFRSGGLH